ncbi:hypothetical protein [Janthinobacterium sp. 17J80-10]|uniref:hypothetical protein n=1 Tax=Janthinobacterium sp. 17J80-10 TaxID=2497863 RepID=UPI0013E8A00C|nr:hypothetical protein [Janthinobacterium sp. 17J80-10]
MLFVVTVMVILMLALASFYLVWSASENGVTNKDLDNVYCHDQAYIAQAPREAWNDPD